MVVQERTAEGRVKEVVADHVLLSQFSLRQIGGIDIAEDEPAIVAPDHELVQLSAVDLKLLVIEAVDQITGRLVGLYKFG